MPVCAEAIPTDGGGRESRIDSRAGRSWVGGMIYLTSSPFDDPPPQKDTRRITHCTCLGKPKSNLWLVHPMRHRECEYIHFQLGHPRLHLYTYVNTVRKTWFFENLTLSRSEKNITRLLLVVYAGVFFLSVNIDEKFWWNVSFCYFFIECSLKNRIDSLKIQIKNISVRNIFWRKFL